MRCPPVRGYTAEIGSGRQVTMNVHRWLAVLLVVATVAYTFPSAPATAQRALQPLGTGARIVPSDTALYAAVDLNASSDQFGELNRLAEYYLGVPAVEELLGQIGQPIGLCADADDLW